MIASILVSGCTQTQTIGPYGSIEGYLFILGNEYFLVEYTAGKLGQLAICTEYRSVGRTCTSIDDIIYTEQELKEYTGLDDIFPTIVRPTPDWVAQMKAIAEAEHTKRVNQYKQEYDSFDFEACRNECRNKFANAPEGALPPVGKPGEPPKTWEDVCTERCTKMPDSLYNIYTLLNNTKLETILVYNSRGSVISIKVCAVKDGRVYKEYNVDINSLEAGLISNYMPDGSEFFTKEKAQEILERYLQYSDFLACINECRDVPEEGVCLEKCGKIPILSEITGAVFANEYMIYFKNEANR